MRVGFLVLTILLFSPARTSAEWQIRPFLGVTFGGSTTFVLAEGAASPNVVFGVSGRLLGDVIGIDVDFGACAGFLPVGRPGTGAGKQCDDAYRQRRAHAAAASDRIQHSAHTSSSGRALCMRTSTISSSALPVTSTLPAMDVGGGVNGFLSDRIGLSWEARYFRSVGGNELRGVSFGPRSHERLSFWRASMALVIRRLTRSIR